MSDEQQAPEGAQPDRPEGWEQIDFNRIPEDYRGVVESRLNRMYRQVKDGQRTMAQLLNDQKALISKVEKLDARGATKEIDEIKAELRQAAEVGDYGKIADLTDKMTSVKSTLSNRDEPKAPTTKEPEPPDVADLMSAEDEARMRAWAAERDGEGALTRPWVSPEHPSYRRAKALLQGFIIEGGMTPAQIMAELDSLMGTRSRPRAQGPVMSGAQPPSSKGKAPKLTAEQVQVAKMMGITPERYAASLQADPTDTEGRRVYRREIT